MRRFVALLLCASIACSTTLPVLAAPAPTAEERAAGAALKKKGDSAMDKLDYASAVTAYAEAWEKAHDPAVLYNKARAHQALAQYPEALESLLLFEKEASPELKAKVPKLAQLEAEIRAKIGTLTVRCNVKGARVLVRERLASFDAPMQIEAGKVVVEVTAEGYLPFKKEIDLPGGTEQTVDVVLVTKATTGVLTVHSEVAGAEVLVDDRPVGKVPAEVKLQAGPHVVLLRSEGYTEARVSVVVDAGASRDVTVSLEKKASITSRWWFWTGVSVVVVTGVVVGYSLLTERKPDNGDFSPGQVSGPLLRF